MDNIFPLGQCNSCVHNKVCKYIEEMNNITLPISIYDSECAEYKVGNNNGLSGVPLPLTDGYGNRVVPEESVELLEEIFDNLFELWAEGKDVTKLTMTSKLMEVLKPAFSKPGNNRDDLIIQSLILQNGFVLPIEIDDSIGEGMLLYDYESDE